MRVIMLIVAVALIQACQQKTKFLKPNLLFIWTDEQNYFTMKAYGNDVIKTPNLDRLADESFVFEKAYVTQPVCTPNRASIMTGLYPHTNGCVANNIPLKKETQTFPEILNDPDYHTAYMGKWHLGDEIFAQHGFETWISIEDLYSNHYGPDKDPGARSDYHHWLLKKGYTPDRDDNKFSRQFASRLPLEHCKPKFLEEKATEYMEGIARDPFILYINFLEPHMPFFGPLDSLYDPEEVIFPSNYYDTLDEVNEPMRYRIKRMDDRAQYGDSEDEVRDLISKYWGLVTQVDISIGTILDKLEELGLSDHTIIVFTSDHGDMMGAHQLVAKSVMYEESVRIPFLLKDPRLSRSFKLIPDRVSQIDIVPTLLDLFEADIPSYLEGTSLMPVLKNEQDLYKDVFIEWNTKQYVRPDEIQDTQIAAEGSTGRSETASIRTVITSDGWKLSLCDYDRSQLFNIDEDPLETTNLFYQDEYNAKVGELTNKIREWQVTTNDFVVFPDQ